MYELLWPVRCMLYDFCVWCCIAVWVLYEISMWPGLKIHVKRSTKYHSRSTNFLPYKGSCTISLITESSIRINLIHKSDKLIKMHSSLFVFDTSYYTVRKQTRIAFDSIILISLRPTSDVWINLKIKWSNS